MTDSLERGREQFGRQRWGDACAALTAADTVEPLAIDDLERLAAASYLVGQHAESADVWARAYEACLAGDDPTRAVRCAFWLWFGHLQAGEMAQAGGWLGRAGGLLDERELAGVAYAYVRGPEAVLAMYGGDPGVAHPAFCEVAEIADQYGDIDLATLARMGQGQCLIFLGNIAEGVGLLDELMLPVTTGAVAPAVAGLVFCAAIEACHGVFDVGRAREWTVALTRWCESQPDLVPYRGQCLVHRAELMQLHGDWPDAVAEATRAEEWLSRPPVQPSVGAACYQQAEVHRLRGDVAAAEEAYRRASQWGQSVQPGLALLRLAQGQGDVAAASIRVALDESQEPGARSAVLSACVEIMLAADDVPAARRATDELAALAAEIDAALLTAMAEHAQGAVLLAESEPRLALPVLRRAWAAWRELDAPYQGARARVLLGHAYRLLGDEDSAVMELDAARWVFQEVGAAPEVARLDARAAGGDAPVDGGHRLTGREIEVLRHLATGKTNRAIASELVISEKTVARHVANIFTKAGLSSRSGATAYAYEHGLI